MKWFRGDKQVKIADKAAQGVAGAILKLQRKFAVSMERYSSSWRRKQQIIFLAAVSIAFITMSITVLVTPFNRKYKIEKPAMIITSKKETVEIMPRITEEEFQRVQEYILKLDSVTIQQRPGLMDSLRMVKELYHSNLK